MTQGARPSIAQMILRAAPTLLLSLLIVLPCFAQGESDNKSLEQLRNVIHYRSGPTCFKDLGSHFGVFWTDRLYSFENSHSSVDESEVEFLTHGWGAKVVDRSAESFGIGPQFVTALYGNDSIVFTPVLQNISAVRIDGSSVSSTGSSRRDFYPYGVEEKQSYPHGTVITAATIFADLDVLLTRYLVENHDSQEHAVRLDLVGTTNHDALEKAVQYDSQFGLLAWYRTPFTVWIEENPEWNSPWVYLGPPDRHVNIYWDIRSNPPPVTVRIENTAKPGGSEAKGTRQELEHGKSGALRYVQSFGPFNLAPHGSTVILVTAGFSFEKPDSAVFGAAKALSGGQVDSGLKSVEAAESRWAGIFQSLPPLPARYERYQRLYHHAAMTLAMDEYQGRGRWLGDRTSSYVARSVLPAMGFWDTCFTSVGMREVDVEKAKDLINVLIDHPLPTSLVPSIMSEENRTGDGQAPILSWAAWRIYEKSHDLDFLKAIYPSAARLNQFWFETQDRNHNGLPEWRNGGQIADNSPRWDKGGRVRVNLNMGEFESPDLIGFLLMDLRCLARIAHALGSPEQAKTWEEKADTLGAKLMARMYFQSENAFWDVDVKTGEPWNHVVTPNMFIPLWAGVPMAPQQKEALIRAHMLNPAEMNGGVPFPSVAYNDKAYDPLAYWRGIMWPHFVYWMVETLEKNGHPQDAERVADRLLETLNRHEYLHECYESSAGKPAGIPEYNWTGAATIELLLEQWKAPL